MVIKHGVTVQIKWVVQYTNGYQLFDTESEADIFYKKAKLKLSGVLKPRRFNYMQLKPKTAPKNRNPHFKHATTKQNRSKAASVRSRV